MFAKIFAALLSVAVVASAAFASDAGYDRRTAPVTTIAPQHGHANTAAPCGCACSTAHR